MRIVIEGNPIPLKRHRVGIRNRKVQCYDSQKEIKAWIQHKLQMAMHEAHDSEIKEIQMEASSLALNQGFKMSLTFYLPIADSDSLAQKNAKLWGFVLCNNKPDCTNLYKFYEDCANEILFGDDRMIIAGEFLKEWSSNPRTVIDIMPIKPISLAEREENILKIFGPELYEEFYEDIKELHYLLMDPNLRPLPEDKRDLLQSTAVLLMQFSEKYSAPLQKIKKL